LGISESFPAVLDQTLCILDLRIMKPAGIKDRPQQSNHHDKQGAAEPQKDFERTPHASNAFKDAEADHRCYPGDGEAEHFSSSRQSEELFHPSASP